MAYQALYRRYRPTTFDEIAGQEHICKTLKNQIETNQISHAYLFTGTRGIGKTSAARIFARAVTCLNPVKGNPCKKCAACLETNPVDIIELDGASNNGVEQAREIRDRVQYLPAGGRYKVYIIDEAHMLTGAAFNALLKTLEEPPAHVVFILCTTEPQKIPATILSRCMRFDFNLVPTAKIAEIINEIFMKLNISATPEAVNAIAAAGEGSVRDALSIADRCAAFGEKLDYETVTDILGATDKNTVLDFAEKILENDSGKILHIINELTSQGKSVGLLAKDLSQAFRDMLVLTSCKNANALLVLPENLFERLGKISAKANTKKLLLGLEVFTELDTKLHYSLSPRLLFEAATLRLADSSGEVDIEAIEMRLTRLEKRGVTPLGNVSAKPTETPPQIKAVAERNFDKARPIWAEVLQTIRNLNYPVLSTILSQVDTVWIEDKVLTAQCNSMQFTSLADKENKKILNDTLIKWGLRFNAVKTENETTEDKKKQLNKIAENIEII
ncbi:MAG TPA: DNA polymerase III subunit gamma/tau [Clostridia bacterium]|nr:DNA polymerase III subunit gamma/tau [Clostridia bacterium]